MSRQKTAAQLKIENRFLRKSNTALALASVANTAIQWIALAFIAWCIYLSIDSLAGRQTGADVMVSFLGNVTVSDALAYALAAGSVGYGLTERKFRKENVERLQARNQELEKLLDARRSSSKLTAKGETNPTDK